MTMHSEDWARFYMPLVGELLKEVFWLIFGKKEKKDRIVMKRWMDDRRNA